MFLGRELVIRKLDLDIGVIVFYKMFRIIRCFFLDIISFVGGFFISFFVFFCFLEE